MTEAVGASHRGGAREGCQGTGQKAWWGRRPTGSTGKIRGCEDLLDPWRVGVLAKGLGSPGNPGDRVLGRVLT